MTHHEDNRSIQLQPETYSRLKALRRPTETNTAAVLRAMDALARRQALPTPVVARMDSTPSDFDFNRPADDASANSYRIREEAYERLAAEQTDGDDSLSDVLDRALDALQREADLCLAVNEVVHGDAAEVQEA